MKSNYEERKENRLAAFQKLADKNENLSDDSYKQAKQIGDAIPFGQPILVGHHSEKKHRKDIDRIDNAMRKSIEADEKAAYYKRRAEAIENSNAISSDDPNAVDKLETKLKGLEANRELMKDCNKIIKSKKTDAEKIAGMVSIGLKEEHAIEVLNPPAHLACFGKGFAHFNLSNNNANIRRVKERIEHLKKVQSIQSSEEEINGVRLVVSQEDNRVQIFFPSIPIENVRKKLKSSGFHWAPSVSAWMRQISGYAIAQAREILTGLSK